MTESFLPRLPARLISGSLLVRPLRGASGRRAHWRLAALLSRQGQLRLALRHLKRSLRFSDRSAPHWQELGECLAALKDDEGAIACYQRSLALQSDRLWTHYHLAQAFNRQGRLVEASSHLRRATELDPSFFWAHQDLGESLYRQGRYAAALACYAAAEAADPESPWPYHHRGDALARLQRHEEAVAAYQVALARQADFFWTHHNLGDALGKLGRWAEAAAAYQAAVGLARPDQRDRALSKQMQALDRAYRSQPGRIAQAHLQSLDPRQRNDLQSLYAHLQVCPDDGAAYRQLATLFAAQGDRVRSLTYASLAQQLAAASPSSEAPAPLPEPPRIPGIPADFVLPPIVGENNDYSFLEEQMRAFVASGTPYHLPVSVVIPTYNRRDRLARTLAALKHQTYPSDLIEVIVADDGGSDGTDALVENYQQHLQVNYVWHEDLGFRAGATRNLGIRHASHDYLILLDADMLLLPGAIEAYMRYFHVSDRAALIGDRRFVSGEDLNSEQILADPSVLATLPEIQTHNPLWKNKQIEGLPTVDYRLELYEKTDYLKQELYPFRAFVTCNVALSRRVFEQVGGFDEAFDRWGYEDLDLGYRIYNEGYYFIPVQEAVALHQEPPTTQQGEVDRLAEGEQMRQLFMQKCPALPFRPEVPGATYQVPKVSIYIPAYNAGRYLKAAIDSALNQTCQDLEVCIVNDGSTDNTEEILKSYAHEPRVRWKSQPNGGISRATNAAVGLCRGMYIGQLDADDTLEPDAVETLVNYLDRHNVGSAYGTRRLIDAEGNPAGNAFNWPVFSREKLLLTMIFHHFRMFRRRDWLRTTGFSEDIGNGSDYDFALKLSEVCQMVHIDRVIYNYRWHGQNTSIVDKDEMDRDDLTAAQRALERLGIADTWEIHIPNPDRPRDKVIRRKP